MFMITIRDCILQTCKNKILNKLDIEIIESYSAKKNITKGTLECSVKIPATRLTLLLMVTLAMAHFTGSSNGSKIRLLT
jgi:hypothetical protein